MALDMASSRTSHREGGQVVQHVQPGDIVRLKDLPLAPVIARTIGIKPALNYRVAAVKVVGWEVIQLKGVARHGRGKFWNAWLFQLECSQDT